MAGFKRERPKGSGRWELIVNLPRDPVSGRRRQKSRTVYGGERVASKELARLLLEAQAGRHGDAEITLSALIGVWLDQVEADLSPTTRAEYRRLARQRIAPFMGKMPLRKVTSAELRGFYRALRKHGLAASTIKNVHTVIRGALDHAVLAEWLTVNPAAARGLLPRGETHEIEPPTALEVKQLIATAEAGASPKKRTGGPVGVRPNRDMAAMIRLAIATGARRGELVALRRTALDLDAARDESELSCGLVKVKRAVVADEQRRLIEKSTKTHAAREVELGPWATDALREHLERMDKRAAAAGVQIRRDAFVFSDHMDCSVPWRPNRVTLAFTRIRDAAGLPRVRFHDLRHARATWELDAGIPLPTVSERLGHRDTATTARIYAHSSRGRGAQAAAVGDEELG